jgi:TRAP-type C4-dicarboxylate transport system substrate-binding protein
VRRIVATALLLCLLAASGAAAERRIKLASFVPEGSIWDKNLRLMGEEWKRETEGRVSLKVFAGGQQGEEPTVVSKMRLGVLQAAALTILGLAHIDEGFNVFAIPFFYESYAELHHVMSALTPELEARLDAKGFVMLNWGDAGWLQVFAKRPVKTLDELRELNIYTSAGFDQMVQWYRANGFEPRPLAFSDVPTALSTGMIEAVPITPVVALFLQWYRTAPHMIEIGLSPLVGATVVTKGTWQTLSEEDRAALRTAAQRTQERLREEVPRQDREAVAEMQRRGLDVSKPSDPEAWRELGDRFAALMRGSYVPEALFDRAVAERDAFRRDHASEPTASRAHGTEP